MPLTVHLLAPNGRAVQVTRDLAGFWTQHYPALRRELGRRYPRHAWPEDGATARPPAAGTEHENASPHILTIDDAAAIPSPCDAPARRAARGSPSCSATARR